MRRTTRLLGFAVAALLALPAAAAATPQDAHVQLLGLNDFHGNLEPPTGSSGRTTEVAGGAPIDSGGAAYLAEHIRQLEAGVENSLVVSAGDLIGASPLLSALFHDEPTIEAMNKIGLDLNAVGNHEFDEGVTELLRMQNGGCIVDKPQESCVLHEFEGADFGFLAANVVREDTGEPLFAPYAIRKFDGIKVGFIGMTLEGTPDIVSASGIVGWDFLDEAETANHYADVLRNEHGVRAIVVLLHEGGAQANPFGIDDCNSLTGPIVDIVNRTTDAVDLFITGHTHQPYNCVIDGRPVTSASSFGRVVTDIDLVLDRQTKDVSQISRNNVVVTRTVTPDSAINDLIAAYQAKAAPLANRVVGFLTGPITRAQDASGESTAGNLIADAQLFASPGSVAAFMNPGGVRTDINAGEVTFGESFGMQPFGNNLVQMDLTGAQIRTLLKQQWCGQSSRITLAPSGVTYTWSQSIAASITGTSVNCATAADPVSNLMIAGAPVVDSQVYRITVNSFLADGGDRFFVLRQGTNRVGSMVDTDALEHYFATGPKDPPALDRINVVP